MNPTYSFEPKSIFHSILRFVALYVYPSFRMVHVDYFYFSLSSSLSMDVGKRVHSQKDFRTDWCRCCCCCCTTTAIIPCPNEVRDAEGKARPVHLLHTLCTRAIRLTKSHLFSWFFYYFGDNGGWKMTDDPVRTSFVELVKTCRSAWCRHLHNLPFLFIRMF